jgi:hypothetical protein
MPDGFQEVARMSLSSTSKCLPVWLATAVAASLLLNACVSTPRNPALATDEPTTVAGGRPLHISRVAADERTLAYVWQQRGQFVRIEAAEPDAQPHQHPLTITQAQMKDALQRVKIDAADAAPFLSDEAMENIAGPLAQAMSRATPAQEVSFAVADRPAGFGRLMSRRVTTGRLYRDGAGLHLIIGLLHTPFEDEMLATGHRIAFTPGSRQHPIQEGWSLGTDDLVTHPVAGREDWVRIDQRAWSGSTLAVGADSAPPPPVPPQTDQGDRYRSLEERLEVLKKLREKGLISEEVYQQKSRQILEDL